MEMQNGTATSEDRQFLRKLNILLAYDLAIALFGIYPKLLKSYIHTKTCICMFIAALFITAQTWKQSRYSPAGEWVNKLWYIQTMEHYSALKRNELSSNEKT